EGEKEKMEEGEDSEEEEEEKQSRSTWSGETASSKGSHRWKRWSSSGRSAQWTRPPHLALESILENQIPFLRIAHSSLFRWTGFVVNTVMTGYWPW
ncbi:mCG145583, partial [Mus musculus]